MYNMSSNPAYYFVEAMRSQLSPMRFNLATMQQYFENENSVLYHTPFAQAMRATIEVAERMTRQYKKPMFGIHQVLVDGVYHDVMEKKLLHKSFCNLIHFKKPTVHHAQPKLLIVAPMAGHHATLLKGTIAALLTDCDIYVTDWLDASQVPMSEGSFDMDDYINYLIEFLQFLGPDVHIMGVCQPTVPVLAAVSIMSQEKDPKTPRSMILIGGPVDARKHPTSVNHIATTHDLEWFQNSLITTVPSNYPGEGRLVYPGFLQLAGFMSMNWKHHLNSHVELFKHLMVEEDEEAEKQKEFYDEYLSVMDLPAEFYLQTIKEVFQRFSLAKGHLISRGRHVHLSDIHNVALLGIEGENDDIAGIGQTKAALSLCKNIPDSHKKYHLQKDVGHYGVFSGSKFRKYVAPVIKDFIYQWDNPEGNEIEKSIIHDDQKTQKKKGNKK